MVSTYDSRQFGSHSSSAACRTWRTAEFSPDRHVVYQDGGKVAKEGYCPRLAVCTAQAAIYL